jgi:anti-anti-sigma factor
MTATDGFSVQVGTIPVFFVRGELDMATTPILNEAIATAIASRGPVVLDLSEVRFMDSTGIHAIMEATQGLPSGCLLLHGVHGPPARTLSLTGIGGMQRLHVVDGCEALDQSATARSA